MSPFWAGLFENLRGRGRNAGLFLAVLPCLLIAGFIAARLREEVCRDYIWPALPWIALVMLAWLVRVFLRARARRRERPARYPLSHDEMRKARAKLARPRAPRAAKNSLVPPA